MNVFIIMNLIVESVLDLLPWKGKGKRDSKYTWCTCHARAQPSAPAEHLCAQKLKNQSAARSSLLRCPSRADRSRDQTSYQSKRV